MNSKVAKPKDSGEAGLRVTGGPPKAAVEPNSTNPGAFAMMATRYFSRYGIAPDEGKAMLARIAVKSHYNGSLNPKAHFRRIITLEQVMNAPIVA